MVTSVRKSATNIICNESSHKEILVDVGVLYAMIVVRWWQHMASVMNGRYIPVDLAFV